MNNNTPLDFSFKIQNLLSTADRYAERLGIDCVTDITCLAALVINEDSPMYRRIKSNDISIKTVRKAISTFFKEYKDYNAQQHMAFEINFYDINKIYYVSQELYDVFLKADDIAKRLYAKDYVGYEEVLIALSEMLPESYQRILTLCCIIMEPKGDVNELRKILIDVNIPHSLSGCLTVLNNEYSPDEEYCRFSGRDKEVSKLMRILAKATKRNAILVGAGGVGKSTIVDILTWLIVTNNCPTVFSDSIVVSLDVSAMIAGTHFRGTAEQRFVDLANFLEENPKCILFIDEIHNILGAGACKEGELDLANSLKPILAKGVTRVIGATTDGEYEKYFSQDAALKRRFEKIVINEPKVNEVYPMIENQIK